MHADDKALPLTVAVAERHEYMAAGKDIHAFWHEITIEPVYVCVRNVNDDLAGLFHAVHLPSESVFVLL